MDDNTPTTEEYAEQIRRLEDEFTGPRGYVGERGLDLQRVEGGRLRFAPYLQHGFFVRLLDSFFDSVTHSFAGSTRRPIEYDLALLLSCFWTLRSSYNIFWQGYCLHATGLLRSAFETILLLAGEHCGRVQRHRMAVALQNSLSRSPDTHGGPALAEEGRKLWRELTRRMLGKGSGLYRGRMNWYPDLAC